MRHLFVAIVLKLALLAGLWWAFVRDVHVGVGSEAAATHLIAGPVPAASQVSQPGGNQ